MKAVHPGVIVVLVAGAAATVACGRGKGSGGAQASPTAIASPGGSLPDPLPNIAARVNGEPVPMRNVRLFAELSLHNGTYPPEQKAQAYRDATDRFIERELLLQEAVAQGFSADQKKLEAAEDKIHSGYPDDKDWIAFLGQQGFDAQSFKTELRARYTVSALLQRRAWVSEEQISDEDVAERYHARVSEFTVAERYKVRQIAILLPAGVDVARRGVFRTKAETILVEARTGSDFATLARKYSEAPNAASEGGLIPPFGKGELDSTLVALEKAVADLKPGQVSDVVESGLGFHILKLEERLPGGVRPLADVVDTVRSAIAQERRAALREALVRSLRAKARIETYL